MSTQHATGQQGGGKIWPDLGLDNWVQKPLRDLVDALEHPRGVDDVESVQRLGVVRLPQKDSKPPS